MKFTPTPLAGAYVVELEPHHDDRGFLARAFCAGEFRQHGLDPAVAQANLSYSRTAGTLRGVHYQSPPAAEAKFVRCLAGAFFDVVVDMRPESSTYLEWFGLELTADNGKAIFIPEGCAHGFLTLEGNTLAYYHATSPYKPDMEQGLRYDDPAIRIRWPRNPAVLSEKDASWPLFEPTT